MKKAMMFACLALLAFAALGLQAQDDADAPADVPEKQQPTRVTPPKPEVPSDYVIGADDTLHVSVWKENDMNVTLPVRPDGKISLPLLNDVQAAGMTPMQLAASITEKP